MASLRSEEGHDEDGLTLGEPYIYKYDGRRLTYNRSRWNRAPRPDGPTTPKNVVYAKIDEGVTCVDHSAFSVRQLLKRIDFSTSVEEIGDNAFRDCAAMKTVKFPPQIRTIGNTAFGHTDLTQLEFPDSLKMILYGAFMCCKSLERVTLPRNAWPFMFRGHSDPLLRFRRPSESLKDEGVGIFENCQKLKHVTIPEGVDLIPFLCFEDCTSITEITFPQSMEEIQCSAFDGCHSLMSIRFLGKESGDVLYDESSFGECPSISSFGSCPSIYEVQFPNPPSEERTIGASLIESINRENNFQKVPINKYSGIREFRNQDKIVDPILWPLILDSSKEDFFWREDRATDAVKTSVRTQKTVIYSLIRQNIDKLVEEQSIRRSRRVRTRTVRLMDEFTDA